MPRYIDADRIDMNQVTVYDYKEQKWTHVFDLPEDIVRCKDCRYYHTNVFGNEIGIGKPYDCLIVGHCCCEFWGRKENGSMAQTAPEGFCSWGERKEDETN